MVQVTPHNMLVTTVEQLTPGVSDAYTNIANPTTVALTPIGGMASVEYTLDPTMTSWKTWAKGTLGVYAEDVLIADVVALRLKVDSGTATMQLIGGRHG